MLSKYYMCLHVTVNGYYMFCYVAHSLSISGELIMVQDFGENRKAAYAAEIKSAHFGKSQVTVHPIVCYYKTEEEKVDRESHIYLSDDINHDHSAVHEFTTRSIEIIEAKRAVRKITMWSDGKASQYKVRTHLCCCGNYQYLYILSMLHI